MSVPIKLLHEVAGFEITAELITGDKYQGILQLIEDNMNCWIVNGAHTSTDGTIEPFESVYLRGSHILYFNVPEMFSNSRLFKTMDNDGKPNKHSGKLKRGFMTVKTKQ